MDLILVVPLNSYIQKRAIEHTGGYEGLKTLRKTGTETPIITDDEKKAYTTSIEYIVQKKLEG